MKLHVIGNSHVRALAEARLQSGDSLRSGFDDVDVAFVAPARFERVPFSERDGSGVRLRIRELAAGRTGPGDLLDERDVWGVCMGLHTIQLVREPFWDTHEPAHVAAPGAAPVSSALMAEIVSAMQGQVFRFMLDLEAAGIRSFLISSPPLHRDHPAIRPRRPQVSLEVDRLARQSMRSFLREHDIGFVEHPAEVADEDGFLRKEWYADPRPNGRPDTSHGSAAYGAVMLERVVSFAEDRFLGVPSR